MGRLLGIYLNFLKTKPYIAQSTTAGVLWLAGDTLAQRIEHGSFSKISGRRLLIFTSFGTFVAGPVMATWYRSLDRMTQPWLTREINKLSSRLKTPDGHKIKGEEAAKKKYAGDVGRLKLRATLFKTTLDMLVFEPPFLTTFFATTNALSGYSWEDNKKKISSDFLPTYKTDLTVWTPTQIVNFRFVPVHLQPVLVNSLNVAWNAFLSTVQSSESS